MCSWYWCARQKKNKVRLCLEYCSYGGLNEFSYVRQYAGEEEKHLIYLMQYIIFGSMVLCLGQIENCLFVL